ncbi:MAG: hypothetical protein OET90_06220 [Desulfuromonadales bacterium]|nr:hypothetical protein [Desulfuromonadales bacterium]
MADKLGELLIKNNLLNQAQLEEALQAQVIFGGKLGTILIEMGLISENVLTEALEKLIGFPCAKPGELQKIPQNVIDAISPDQADRHQAVPVALSGKKLTLAMADPQDLQSIDDLSFRTGFIIKPILALEVRLVIALEKYYNIKRTMRYVAAPNQAMKAPTKTKPKPSAPPAAARQKKPPVNEPDVFDTVHEGATDSGDDFLGEPGSEHIYQKVPAKTAPAQEPEEIVEAEELEIIEDLSDDDLIEELVEEDVTLATTAQALVDARDRNDVADALIRHLGAHFKRAALFIVVAGQVSGWRSAKDNEPIPGFEQFQLPLAEPSVLKTAVESNSYFLGPVPATGANLALTTFLGQPAPKSALLLPMSMLGRVVGLVYVDDPKADLSEAVIELQKLVSKGLMAFEILILQNKILRS